MEKLKCGVVGATGYAGAELVRLLLNHPNVTLEYVSSVSYTGQRMDSIFPSLKGVCDLTLTDADSVVASSDVVFAALPHGLSEELAEKTHEKGSVIIDLGADFRLTDESVYKKWYGKEYKFPELHKYSLYCLPELNREKIKNIDIIANPGCYPTSIALGLMPALKNGLIENAGIIIDSKSGVTGAGRGLTQGTHFPDTNEAFAAYKAGNHRHTPEIEQTLSGIAGQKINVTFTPHLLPVNRGIESSIYCRLKDDIGPEDVRAAYEKAYENEFFVRVLPDGEYANIKNVRCTNFCDISLHYDMRTCTLIICSVIDNMVKGAAGQAIQNMNIRFGFPEEMGLKGLSTGF